MSNKERMDSSVALASFRMTGGMQTYKEHVLIKNPVDHVNPVRKSLIFLFCYIK
jgi:hypothetical protein